MEYRTKRAMETGKAYRT